MAKSNKSDVTFKVKDNGNLKVKLNSDKAKQYFTEELNPTDTIKCLITEIEIAPESKQDLIKFLVSTDLSLNFI